MTENKNENLPEVRIDQSVEQRLQDVKDGIARPMEKDPPSEPAFVHYHVDKPRDPSAMEVEEITPPRGFEPISAWQGLERIPMRFAEDLEDSQPPTKPEHIELSVEKIGLEQGVDNEPDDLDTTEEMGELALTVSKTIIGEGLQSEAVGIKRDDAAHRARVDNDISFKRMGRRVDPRYRK